jgi:hypothetical protein
VTPGGRAQAADVVVVFRAVPPVIEVGRHFALDVRLCADGTPPVLAGVDADMPAHRHGMNYRPSVTARGDGRYRADGLLFHMPGRWRVTFEVERDGRRTRLGTDLVIE